jgi:hypothetical protein
MPKANAKDVYYFSHDCNARNDEKILAMRSVYGLEGYAMYFMTVEILREQNEYKLEITKYIWNTLAMQMHTDAQKVKDFINDCVNEFHLFVIENNFLYSESLIKRMNLFKEISEIRSKAAKKRWENSNDMQNECKSNANADQKQSNKTKLNNNKLNQTKLDYTKKEDINKKDNTPDGVVALSGDGEEIFIHKNSCMQYMVKNGKMYDLQGRELNSAGFPIIDFGLSKHNT